MKSTCLQGDFFDKWAQRLSKIETEDDFFECCLYAAEFQYENNAVYRQWCDLIGRDPRKISKLEDIVFLPISLFKTKDVCCFDKKYATDFFLSSGTGNDNRSKHFIFDKDFYIENAFNCFCEFFSSVDKYCYLCLLPNYMEQEHSSLICMMDAFVKQSEYKQSGFYADNLAGLASVLADNESKNIDTILFGVSYALLDLAETFPMSLNHTVVFETGGMKGRRKEISKQELHEILKKGLGVDNIASEYGMCELFSQAYSVKDGLFFVPKTMRVLISEINDYTNILPEGRRGRINVVDLANIASCCFVSTQDVGIKTASGRFEIEGRVDHSDIRGCNLMYGR